MSERRPWSEEEDRILKQIFETNKLTKWSHIARKLLEEYGIKGRNGKQCKERYINHIDTSHPKDEWCYDDERRMFDLHNLLGNKWAIIGQKLGGRTDNCVKNHFYSLLRKSLRKLNRILGEYFRKDYKEIKANVLYKLVEASDEKYRSVPAYQNELTEFAYQLKNKLLEYSYEGEECDPATRVDSPEDLELAKALIDGIYEFSKNYKKKSKKERRGSCQLQLEMKGPTRSLQANPISQKEESEGSSLFPSSSTSLMDESSDDDIVYSAGQSRRKRRASYQIEEEEIEVRIRTRACSQGNMVKSKKSQCYQILNAEEKGSDHPQIDEKDDESQIDSEKEKKEEQIKQEEFCIQKYLQDLNIMEDEDNHAKHGPKGVSQGSMSEEEINPQQEPYRFFEDSAEMRAIPVEGIGSGKFQPLQDKLFK